MWWKADARELAEKLNKIVDFFIRSLPCLTSNFRYHYQAEKSYRVIGYERVSRALREHYAAF
ncbi:hypothetical protein FHS96_002152 [Sphingomonas zeicaulis]|uniref:hypothetical protein n=1 Tax=Sphingomonas zeicaulis TaxID=1632740 RepID=UPI003D23A4F5